MIAIVAALPQELHELENVAKAESGLTREVVMGRTFMRGSLRGMPVTLVQSGVGKVAAATTATLLCQRRVKAVLMVGTAGGLGPNVARGDLVVADALLQHDADARPLFPRWETEGVIRRVPDPTLTSALSTAADEVLGQVTADLAAAGLGRPRRHTGLIVSGDTFIHTQQAAETLHAELPDALAVEMEGAALAQVCSAAGVPFAVARTISDRADDDADTDFVGFLTSVAAPYAREVIVRALELLGRQPAYLVAHRPPRHANRPRGTE